MPIRRLCNTVQGRPRNSPRRQTGSSGLCVFDTHADEAKIGKGTKEKELLSLLDDNPFRLVYQNGLVESKNL